MIRISLEQDQSPVDAVVAESAAGDRPGLRVSNTDARQNQ